MLEKMLALQNKRKKEGGFTLVELIVVLVILAILAALLIPALTGYIDKAKQKSAISECRSAVMAAQTLADEAYAAKATSSAVTFGAGKDVELTKVEELAELKANTVKNASTDAKGHVNNLKYDNGTVSVEYDGTTYTPTSK